MIDIQELTLKDKGKWVTYLPTMERGRIRSWNNKYIFVVYHCNEEWDRYFDFTGAATKPNYLTFDIPEPPPLFSDQEEIEVYREFIEDTYTHEFPEFPYSDFGEILCYEIHSQPINPRMGAGEKGLTFKELAKKWGISVTFLGELIADHCEKLDRPCNYCGKY